MPVLALSSESAMRPLLSYFYNMSGYSHQSRHFQVSYLFYLEFLGKSDLLNLTYAIPFQTGNSLLKTYIFSVFPMIASPNLLTYLVTLIPSPHLPHPKRISTHLRGSLTHIQFLPFPLPPTHCKVTGVLDTYCDFNEPSSPITCILEEFL